MSSKYYNIDVMDLDILKYLQEDGHRSLTDISKTLGVSVATIRYPEANLLQDKILRIIGRADPYRIGFRSPADLQLEVMPGYTIDEVAEAIADTLK